MFPSSNYSNVLFQINTMKLVFIFLSHIKCKCCIPYNPFATFSIGQMSSMLLLRVELQSLSLLAVLWFCLNKVILALYPIYVLSHIGLTQIPIFYHSAYHHRQGSGTVRLSLFYSAPSIRVFPCLLTHLFRFFTYVKLCQNNRSELLQYIYDVIFQNH